MTWAKLPPELAEEAARDRLSDSEFRCYVECMLWLYSLEDSSLKIPQHMLPRICAADDPVTAAAGLVKRKWMGEAGEDYVVIRHANVIRSSLLSQQSTRRKTAKRIARHRERHRSDDDEARGSDHESVTHDETRDVTRYLASKQARNPR